KHRENLSSFHESLRLAVLIGAAKRDTRCGGRQRKAHQRFGSLRDRFLRHLYPVADAFQAGAAEPVSRVWSVLGFASGASKRVIVLCPTILGLGRNILGCCCHSRFPPRGLSSSALRPRQKIGADSPPTRMRRRGVSELVDNEGNRL